MALWKVRGDENLNKDFFCSNASMASAGSLYKLLLAVLINAKEAGTGVEASRASNGKMITVMSLASKKIEIKS